MLSLFKLFKYQTQNICGMGILYPYSELHVAFNDSRTPEWSNITS